MFTTGIHLYLYLAGGLYGAAFLLYLLSKQRAAFLLLITGFIINFLYLLGRGWLGGIFFPNPVFEGPFLLPCCIALVSLVMRTANRDSQWARLLLPAFIFSLFAMWYAKGMIPPTPKKITPWATAFFLTESMGHALFYSGALLALAALVKRETTDAFHDPVVWGFLIFSVSQVTGAVWCYTGWGNTFRWGPRHMTTAAIWLTYAAYLHLRYISGWNMKKRAVYVIIAAGITLFGSFGSYIHEMNFPRIGG